MARFSAITSESNDSEDERSSESQSSEEEDVHVHVHEEELESESSVSAEEEEEPLPSPPQKKPSRAEDEDNDVRELDLADATAGPSQPRGDPTLIRRAQQIGIDAQRMHVMQTSLFRMPEEAAALRAMNRPTRAQIQITARTLRKKHRRDSDGDGLRFDFRERASFAHDLEPVPYRQYRKYARVESSASAVKGNEGAIVDAGLALGRSFRVGWGPRGVLVHLGEICGPSSTPRTSANSSVVTKTTVPIFVPGNFSDDASTLLQHHLTHSPIQPDEDGTPFANPSPNLRFSSLVSLFSPADRSYKASLFRLGSALFDEMDLGLGDSISIDIRRRIEFIRRKAILSEWLEDIVAPSVDSDLKELSSTGSAASAYTLLTGHQTKKACIQAEEGLNWRLASLISQGAGDFEFQEDLRDQLRIWREQRIDAHIDDNIRKIYALLAGVADVVQGSEGTDFERCSDLDLLKGLDWKRTFGLHLWFFEPLDATIGDVFQSYSRRWADSPNRVTPPLPQHIKSPPPSMPSSPRQPLDGLYSLIRIHADPACSLSQVLTPLSFGPSPADYSLSWHLYILLSRCIRVRDFADRDDPGADVDMDIEDLGEAGRPRVEGHSPSADLLASSYAFQLEQEGMIQEAVFVLLHIEGSVGREKAIKDLLFRSAPVLDEWMTRGLVGSLKIPASWVNEAKAIHALDSGDVWEAYEFYITAGLYNAAHELAVLELAPEAVIRQDLDLLKSLFEKIAKHPVIGGWHSRGKAFLDYVEIMTRLPELHEELQDPDTMRDAAQGAEFEDLTRRIPKLISILPEALPDRSDPRHNVALAKMMAGLMLHLDKVQPLGSRYQSSSQVQPSLVDQATTGRLFL